jgi:hypothetical protein
MCSKLIHGLYGFYGGCVCASWFMIFWTWVALNLASSWENDNQLWNNLVWLGSEETEMNFFSINRKNIPPSPPLIILNPKPTDIPKIVQILHCFVYELWAKWYTSPMRSMLSSLGTFVTSVGWVSMLEAGINQDAQPGMGCLDHRVFF